MDFSIIIPAHNAELTIEKTLQSVYSQSFRGFECIVIADACTDKTAEIARSFGATVIETDLQNECLGRNLGIDRSSGRFLLFLDADDWLLHEFCLEQLFKRWQSHTEHFDIIAFDMVWKHIGVVHPISGRDGQLFPHCTNKCWRREFISDMRFPNVKPDGDASFHEIIMQANPKIDIWDMPIYYYNFLRDGSYSSSLHRSAIGTKQFWGIK